MNSTAQTEFAFPDVPLFDAHEHPRIAYGAIAAALHIGVRRMRTRILLSSQDIESLISSLGNVVQHANVNQSEDVAVLKMRRKWGREGQHTAEGRVLLLRPPGLRHAFQVFSDGHWDLWDRVIGHGIRHAQPVVGIPSLTTEQIQYLMDGMCKQMNATPATVRVVRLSFHSRIQDPTAQKKKQTITQYTDLSLRYAFATLQEQGAALEKLHFEIAGEQTEGAVGGYISRTGEMAVDSSFPRFHRALLAPASDIADRQFAMLLNRERIREHGFEARPFFVEFRTPVFSDRQAHKRLIDALEQMPNTSHALIHQNPYLHLMLFDRVEGMSCDIYVLSERRMAVLPQTESSPTALGRLYSYVSTRFGEGEIRDYSEVYGD